MFKLLLAITALSSPAFATEPVLLSTDPQPASSAYLFQLSYEDAESAIGEALATRGAGAKVAAMVQTRRGDALFSYGKPIRVEIHGLQFDKQTRRWSASLTFLANEEVVSAQPVAGRYEEVVEVPVLRHEIKGGEVIAHTDIEIRDVLRSHTRADTVTDMDELVGKAPVRGVSAGRPVRLHEISAPVTVKKNGLVQMHYNTPGMEITASGQATVDGAAGDVITVRNVASKRIVQAVVVDSGNVTILPPATSLSENQIQLPGVTHATN